ncbi:MULTISPECIES: hypothetical protein [unclassified Ruegeria]|uniref:hypothetical protein n=1 Tax=unclassified Ruegeria TaxID=2625375 RepID=UPI001492262A|nr:MULTISPECIES: hypothetical protein [unclassified Ruegeria]NOD35927.1 hypothetical protein [Ruegeria sp. HKCCD7296]NOE43319.1 hypothetical protein [Ruegeria sp. HKCCD7319]
MKILISCMACQAATGIPCGHRELASVTAPGFYETTCPSSSEKTFLILQGEKFEVFFEKSLLALHNEAYSEAVILSVTAIELFLNFATKVMAATKETTFESLERIDKSTNTAERNIGAYLLASELWATQNASHLPIDLKFIDKVRKTRNKCAHDGYLPPPEKAQKHVESLAKACLESICILREKASAAFDQVFSQNNLRLANDARERQKQLGIESTNPATVCPPFRVGLLNAEAVFDIFKEVEIAYENQLLFTRIASN